MRLPLPHCLVMLLWGWAGCFNSYAQSTCSTTAAGNWATASLWSCGSVPSGAYSGTIIVNHNLTINAPVNITGKVVILLRNNATLDVRGSNAFTLPNNDSVIDVPTGSWVGGQNANSTVTIGTGAASFTYKMNGSATFRGPDIMTSRGLGSLPVELLYFTAKAEGQRVSVAWATANEQNADRFVVERSTDLREFGAVGSVAAAGNSQVRRNYGLIDEQPLMGISYYRLRQVDRDGRMAYSRSVAVQVQEGQPGLLVLGNPVRGTDLRLSVQNLDDASYQLQTLLGVPVVVDAQKLSNREVMLRLPAHLPGGLYVLQVRYAGGQLSRKVLVE